MNFSQRLLAFAAALLVPALLSVFFPSIDLAVAELFFDGADFPWRDGGLAEFLHGLVQPVAVIMGVLLALATLLHLRRRTGWRRWAFLLVTLLVGPGLVTNVIFKDHWGRARPLQVAEFGGPAQFTPALVLSDQCAKNCSFVSGDASFGFWMHSFAYIAPRRRRPLFWAGLGIGALGGLLRVGMGAHFFSDVVFGGILMLLVSAGLYAALFGQRALAILWREFLGVREAGGGRVSPRHAG